MREGWRYQGAGRQKELARADVAVWGVLQLFTGAWSDRIGRKRLIVWGMWVQAAGIAVTAATSGFAMFALGALLLGAGTAMVYPTLLAAIGDVAHPTWRASAVGVYRLWRDAGFAAGALLAGVIAVFASGVMVWVGVGALALGAAYFASRSSTPKKRATSTNTAVKRRA